MHLIKDASRSLDEAGRPRCVIVVTHDNRIFHHADHILQMDDGLIKQELLLPFIGGVFVIEALSVIIQVGSYKLRKKRVFKMAPIHHHFELLGWSESKVIVRFWIASLVFALFATTGPPA